MERSEYIIYRIGDKKLSPMSVVAQNSSTDDQSVEFDFTKSRNVTNQSSSSKIQYSFT
jgi:hypothetical protein